MFSNLSLRAKLYLHYGIVIVPVLIVLGYFLHTNDARFTATLEKFSYYDAAVNSERQYKRFIDAVTDAIDTEKLGEPGLAALKQTHDSLAKSGIQSAEAKQLSTKLLEMHASLTADGTITNLSKHRDQINQSKTQIAKIVEDHDTMIASDLKRDLKRAERDIMFSRILSVLVTVLAFFLAHFLIRSIHRPLQRAITVADRISQGKLDNPSTNENNTEIGKLLSALNKMNARLREIIGKMVGASQQVNSASHEIKQNNSELSVRAREAAFTMEETASSLDGLAATVGQTADRTRSAQSLVSGAVSNAENSSHVARQMAATMDEIQISSNKIVDIISVIDGIAFQTNILALNAAVEAARAGELGAGFAVVAGEVRSLAQRCATAAKDIKSLIGSSVEKVSLGTQLADNVGKAMDNTAASIQQVSELLGEIASASTEQREGINQINQAMRSLEQAASRDQNATNRAAQIAEMLSDHAQTLNGLSNQFDLGTQLTTAPLATASPMPVVSRVAPLSARRSKIQNRSSETPDADWKEY